MNQVFNQGPNVHVFFYTNASSIQNIKLKLGSCFQFQILGPATFDLKELITKWVYTYLQKQKKYIELPLDLSRTSPYSREVLEALRLLPFGQLDSYQTLALKTSSPKAVRAVGSSCKKNPFSLVIPCHRVIRSDQTLGQFNGGIEIKKRLLAFEGALDQVRL